MSSLITVDAGTLIDEFKTDLEPLVADSGKSFDRLRSVFLIAVQQNPEILECSPESIRRELTKCAADGLVPDNKEAAMIPYKKVLQYQPMVHGIIKRLRELGGVFSITCRLVYEKDNFVLNEADPDSLVHTSDPFAKDRGAIVGGYAIFRDNEKRLMHLETMSMEDFENVRNASKAPDSPAWKKWASEMYKKAVLRRGAKYISTNNDKIRELLERQDDMFEFNQPRRNERFDPFSGEVIDGQIASETKQVTKAPASDDRPKQEPARQEPVKQNRTPRNTDQKEKKPEDKTKQPSFEPVDLNPADRQNVLECCEKILRIALDTSIDAADRRGVLKLSAENWRGSIPDYAAPMVRSCISITDWAILQDLDGKPWTAEHAMFVHKVQSHFDVEKLNIGKYP